MPPRGASKRLALLLLVLATVGPPGVLSEQNVGCIFSKSLCLKEEWCYNDEAFGRCVTGTGDLIEDDLFRFDLERESLHELKSELTRLYALGYRWSHGYTQCRLQTMLYAIKNELDFDPNSCSDLTDSDLGSAVKVLEGQVPVNPEEIAIIKYTPSVDKPHGEYADEVYYPPVDNGARETLREKIMPSNGIDIMDMEDPNVEYAMIKRSYIPQMRRRSITPFFDERYGIPKYRRANPDSLDSLEFLENYGNDIPEPKIANLYPEGNFGATADIVGAMFPVNKLMNDLQLSPTEMRKFLSTENYQTLNRLLEEYEAESRMTPPIKNMEEPRHHQNIPDDRLEVAFNTPNAFSAGWSLNENIDEPLSESRIYYDENNDVDQAEYGSGYQVHPEEIFSERKTDYYGPLSRNEEIFRELKQQQDLQNKNFEQRWGKMKPMVYTEGGAVPEDIGDKFDATESRLITRENINNILDRYNLGFKRPERLDVKKPGPPFDQQISDPTLRNSQLQKNKEETFLPSMMKKEPRNPVTYQEYKPYGNEDDTNDYVYVQLNTEISSWSQGKSVIGNISQLLHLENSAFSDGKVEAYAVSFKVNLNSRSYDASEVAKIIIEKMDELSEKTGLEIMAAGIGDKNGIKTIISSKLNTESQYIVIFLVCGVLVAMIIAAALLILIRRHIKIKEKLSGLSRPDTEASKDYQDLCRARMATKTQPAESSVPGRITSLSRESEQSPSSRSSTSSWSEEPALHNMDISTGHMVLSYMEDHLKNKDRLEQEWVALCAYVAEPCETSIALKKENLEKNRYPEIVPYDHARVVLNELSNVSGSDYINASSITDHDPRNPAYIATQGPLPLTAPDFWQLIWEQGAVVIVMLTRLTEGGAAMCHRYWPEEGSEVYHIYEVHLVSEHIWCDDYLVRSFYLKNVRTGETRTVTQFHFLSWPEGGVPASTKALLEFRRKVNKSYRGRSCPIVVHCSDGAGRTGTYSLIDMVLSRMAKGAKEIDIAATLEHLRDQRPKMVATKQQFEFVLTAVAEEVHAILKALPPQPVPTQSQEKQEK